MFPELVNEAIPSQNVPKFVGHRCEVEPLRDEGAIAEKQLVRSWGVKMQERPLQLHYQCLIRQGLETIG